MADSARKDPSTTGGWTVTMKDGRSNMDWISDSESHTRTTAVPARAAASVARVTAAP